MTFSADDNDCRDRQSVKLFYISFCFKIFFRHNFFCVLFFTFSSRNFGSIGKMDVDGFRNWCYQLQISFAASIPNGFNCSDVTLEQSQRSFFIKKKNYPVLRIFEQIVFWKLLLWFSKFISEPFQLLKKHIFIKLKIEFFIVFFFRWVSPLRHKYANMGNVRSGKLVSLRSSEIEHFQKK